MRALYIRTSTADQDGEAQRHALLTAAAARGWTEYEVVTDIGISGGKASRPGLDALKQKAKTGKLREVMVVALDRLGRSLRDLLLLMDDLGAAGCAVISLRESLDLSTPTGRLMFQLLSSLAEYEKSLIRERVVAGITKAKQVGTRSGKAIGRPRREFDVQQAQRLREQGASWRKLAMAMKVPVPTLRRALRAVERPS